MIHGAGGRSQVWQAQIHLLKNCLNVLALDLPGHGKTDGHSENSVAEYAQWVSKMLVSLLSGPVFLMGHSMGGAIVQETALLHPDLLKGIILVSTGAQLQVAPKFLAGLLTKFEETVDSIIGYAYAPDADPVLVREGAKLMKAAGPKVLHDDFEACDRFDRSMEVGKIELPCLIVCGDKDILSPPALSERLHDSIKGSRLKILPNAGHMVMIESYKAFSDCVRHFVL
jgi:pimeloyl-ACP methyl ester carboxylesterase